MLDKAINVLNGWLNHKLNLLQYTGCTVRDANMWSNKFDSLCRKNEYVLVTNTNHWAAVTHDKYVVWYFVDKSLKSLLDSDVKWLYYVKKNCKSITKAEQQILKSGFNTENSFPDTYIAIQRMPDILPANSFTV